MSYDYGYKFHVRGHGFGVYISRDLFKKAGIDIDRDRYIVTYDEENDLFIVKILRGVKTIDNSISSIGLIFVPAIIAEHIKLWSKKKAWHLINQYFNVGEKPTFREIREVINDPSIFGLKDEVEFKNYLKIQFRRGRRPEFLYYGAVAASRLGLKSRENILSFASVIHFFFTGKYITYGTLDLDRDAILFMLERFKVYYDRFWNFETAVKRAFRDLVEFYLSKETVKTRRIIL